MEKDYRKQKFLTVSNEQAEFIKANAGQMSISKLATMLGISKNICYNNMKVLQLTKHPRHKPKYKIPLNEKCKVIDFSRNGYFDIDKFSKLYNY